MNNSTFVHGDLQINSSGIKVENKEKEDDSQPKYDIKLEEMAVCSPSLFGSFAHRPSSPLDRSCSFRFRLCVSIQFGDALGSGVSGTVYKAIHEPSGKAMAVKVRFFFLSFIDDSCLFSLSFPCALAN
jgi:hypothetical protein